MITNEITGVLLIKKLLVQQFIAVLLFVTINTYSQGFQIQARVVDSETFQPVSFATVSTGTSTGTITDELGYFRIQSSENQKKDSLYFSCIGYHSRMLAITDLDYVSLDTVFLDQHFVELEEVHVETKSKKALKSKQIIRKAIDAITGNYPALPVKLDGYYREYIKQEDRYINVLESIIELRDPGINSEDEFSAGMLFKRMSTDFPVDRELMKPYDNIDKLIPYSIAPVNHRNELTMLRSHDPVRNYDQDALFFIDCLDTRFLKNHDFNEPQLTYLDNRPYYALSFIDNRDFYYDHSKIIAEGTIFIDGINYGIKRFNYIVSALNNPDKQKIFELSLEYNLGNGLYYLNYLSFNNLFYTRNFSVSDIMIFKDCISLEFSKPVDTASLIEENFEFKWKGREMRINKLEIDEKYNALDVYLDGSNEIYYEKIDQTIDFNSSDPTKYSGDKVYISKNMDISINNVYDIEGNLLQSRAYNDYYQYREFFVRDIDTVNTTIAENLMNQGIPVFDNRIFGEMTDDTLWLNTPLIAEETKEKTVHISSPVLQSGVENLYYKNDRTLTEAVYLHTDREVYAPADTIWFKAYIRDLERLSRTSLSQTLMVCLADESGKVIQEGRFFIENSDSHGQFSLNHELEEGEYYLLAFSSWMLNFDTELLYSKKILIRNEQRPGKQLVVYYNKSSYAAGDTMKLQVHCYDELNRDIDDVKYSYRIQAGNELIQKGQARTSGSSSDSLVIIVPDQLSEIPRILIRGDHKGQILDTTYRLPVMVDLNVDFFPEGGKCINGLSSRIAYKVQDLNGTPVEIRGDIVDQNGKLISTTNSEHEGMGVFTVTPARGLQLYFQIRNPEGYDKQFPLPEAVDSGWLLSGKSEREKLRLTVNRYNTSNDIALITVMIRGYLTYYKQIRVKNKTSFDIPIKELPPGIAVVTLFNSALVPKAERLFYTNLSGGIVPELETDRSVYVPRDKVELNLKLQTREAKDLRGSYSLTVVDDQLCSADYLTEPNIRSTFLFSPEIKGYIHNPDYYTDTQNPGMPDHLDLLLMTQGWRDYTYLCGTDWKEGVSRPTDRETISGTLVKQPFGKKTGPVKGEINVYFGGNSVKVPVDNTGRFEIRPAYDLKNNSGVLLSGSAGNGLSKVTLQIDSTAFEKQLSGYLKVLADSLNQYQTATSLPYISISDNFSLGLTYFQWIEEVEVVKARIRPEGDQDEWILEDFIVVNKKEARNEVLESSTDLLGVLENMGIPVDHEIENDAVQHLVNPQSVIGWVVDDVYYGTEYSYVSDFRPVDIEKLFLVKHADTQLFGLFMPEVIVSIRLKKYQAEDLLETAYGKYTIGRYEVSKEFYEPKYDTEERRKSTIPDLRKTILWEPELELDPNGNASIGFYNGDRYTNIRCILEGITDDGIPVYTETTYDVSLSRE